MPSVPRLEKLGAESGQARAGGGQAKAPPLALMTNELRQAEHRSARCAARVRRFRDGIKVQEASSELTADTGGQL